MASRGRYARGCPRTRTASHRAPGRRKNGSSRPRTRSRPRSGSRRADGNSRSARARGRWRAGSSSHPLARRVGHVHDAVAQRRAEEPGRHAVVEVDVVEHVAQVALAAEIGMHLWEGLPVLDERELSGELAAAEIRALVAAAVASAAVELVEML